MKSNIITIVLIGLAFISCSSDDSNIENENIGEIQFGDTNFEMTHAYINDENIVNENPSDLAVILSNRELLVDNINSGINIMYVDYRGIDFEVGSKELLNYRITENASRSNGLIQGGERVLDDYYNSGLTASSVYFKIISLTETQISVEFSFTREDGLLFTGNYSGSYTNVSE